MVNGYLPAPLGAEFFAGLRFCGGEFCRQPR